ncbi:hypothetical protein TRIUR3_12983 [Triticum urartu]|uniref:Uncharacterized protein n=1 Tax=Triticum urartu TaxID=4572 RepID=M7ZMY2_TRIUA|nr:hypothetical protein TRIUR3_12983 [Triticum urartu]
MVPAPPLAGLLRAVVSLRLPRAVPHHRFKVLTVYHLANDRWAPPTLFIVDLGHFDC